MMSLSSPPVSAPSPVCWFNISISQSRHFLFLVGVLTPSWPCSEPVWGTVIYCPKSPVRSQHGCLGEHRNNHTHAETHTHTHTLKLYPQSHDNPRWVAEMFAMLQSLCPAELTVTDRNKQNTDIHDPDLCQRVQTVTTEKRMVQQIQPKWKLQQLFCGHDKDEPDSHLDPPKNDQKINITSGKMKGWYICLCKAQNGF